MGMMRATGEVLLNPPMDTTFGSGDQVIAISEDDDTLVLRADAGGGLPEPGAIAHARSCRPRPSAC